MKIYRNYLVIIFLGALFYIPFIGNVHLFDWDEVNFAEISREMIMTGDFLKVQVGYTPFYEKPPLFFWLQIVSMKAFGINEFAARFPNTIIGIITLLVLYRIGSRLFNSWFGMIWAIVYLGSILPLLYFKSGIIDPLFNLIIFLSIFFFLKFKWKKDNTGHEELKWRHGFYIAISGLFAGLALLTKGPVAYLIIILTTGTYWATQRFRFFISFPKFLWFSLITFAVMFSWLGLETCFHGPAFMKEFINYQIRLFATPDAGHNGFPGFHAIVLLLGCFPASVFAIRGFYKMNLANVVLKDFRKWMIILFWVVLVLFSIVQSKIVHYSSLAYFPVTFLASLVISNIIDRKISLNNWLKAGLISIVSVFIIIAITGPYIGRNIDLIKPFFRNNPDGLASLNAEVNWTGREILPGLILMAVAILFFILIKKQKIFKAMMALFIGNAVVVMTGLIFYTGRIEMYSQNASVEFCKSLEGKDCYVKTSGFKSYIPAFYSRRIPPVHAKSDDIGWLTWEPVDKDVYIIAKSHLKEYWSGVPTVDIIGEKNGFLFIKRKP